MQIKWMIGAAALLAASPALAMKVSNLDSVPHRVLFEVSGNREIFAIAPGETHYIAGQPSGTLSLLSAQDPKPSRGTLHADGLLSGIVGAERTDDIPADSDDNFVIWPGGKLSIQQHMRSQRQGR